MGSEVEVVILEFIAVVTKAVVAICIVLVPVAAVGAVGVPVNWGEANEARLDLVTDFGIVIVLLPSQPIKHT